MISHESICSSKWFQMELMDCRCVRTVLIGSYSQKFWGVTDPDSIRSSPFRFSNFRIIRKNWSFNFGGSWIRAIHFELLLLLRWTKQFSRNAKCSLFFEKQPHDGHISVIADYRINRQIVFYNSDPFRRMRLAKAQLQTLQFYRWIREMMPLLWKWARNFWPGLLILVNLFP